MPSAPINTGGLQLNRTFHADNMYCCQFFLITFKHDPEKSEKNPLFSSLKSGSKIYVNF